MEPFLVTGQTDFLRRCTVDGRIPVDADDGHWSLETYFAGGDRAWIQRVAPQDPNLSLIHI